MLNRYFHSRRVLCRVAQNPLAKHLAALAEHLDRRGHAATVVQSYLQAAEHFGRWLGSAGLAVDQVDPAAVRTFLTRHLPGCHCPPPRSRTVATVRAALNHLMLVVRNDCGNAVLSPVDSIAKDFDSHLEMRCGLAAPTRLSYGRFVREFLAARYDSGPIDLTALAPADVAAFVVGRAAHVAPGSANVIAVAMRSFLRYLRLLGIGNEGWLAAVPRAAQWRLAQLPLVFNDDELSAFLAAFDRTKATGRRGYALALCFTELGLRVGEVARLALNDIDWRAGVLSLTPGKTRRASQLPLPAKVATSLADYVRHGRPPTTSRLIFVHHRAPRGEPLGASGVRSAIRAAYGRAGLGKRRTGTHVLRHTAATRMLRAGVSLKEIADVLRHRSLDTTAIYAKVDRAALAEVAMPWPRVRP